MRRNWDDRSHAVSSVGHGAAHMTGHLRTQPSAAGAATLRMLRRRETPRVTQSGALTRRGPLADPRGSVLTVTLGFMVVLLVIAAGVHGLVLAEIRGSGALRERTAADELASGALARSFAWFRATDYQPPATASLVASVPVLLAANKRVVVLPSNHPDSYTDVAGQAQKGIVASFQKFLSHQSGAVGTYSVDATLMSSDPERWEVIATAQVGRTTRRAGALFTRTRESLFSTALFGAQYVNLNGNAVIDSYDATLGSYGGSNVQKRGHVGSNGTIALASNAIIYGNGVAGPSGSVTGGTVTGQRLNASKTRTLPILTVPAAAVNVGAITLSSKTTMTLTAGTYVASSVAISGQATLIADTSKGPVTLYVTGSISIGGNGVLNTTGQPRFLSIVQVGGTAVSYAGNGTFAGTIYAPQSVLSLSGNGVLHGSFAGKAIEQSGNGVIHFDEALKTILMPGSGTLRLTMQWSPPA